ncbi:hypothetical protein D3C76_792030 [compost metagenome]
MALAPAHDGAVDEIDLGDRALFQALQHRGTEACRQAFSCQAPRSVRAGEAQADAGPLGDGDGFADRCLGGAFQQRLAVQLAITEHGDAAERACRHVDQQLVPHGAENVVADRGGEPGAIESLGDGLHTRGPLAVELADEGVFACHAGTDRTRRQQHATDVGLAGQYPLTPHGLGQDVFVAKTVLQR